MKNIKSKLPSNELIEKRTSGKNTVVILSGVVDDTEVETPFERVDSERNEWKDY